ncbi:MAG: hypothetical protein IKH31_00435 [Clostridia bacterium]|nr:hypothetical protein [Clostridia bacterium]
MDWSLLGIVLLPFAGYLLVRLVIQATNLSFAEVVMFLALVGATAYVYLNSEKLGIDIDDKDSLLLLSGFLLAAAIFSFFDGALTFVMVGALFPVEHPIKVGLICGAVVIVLWFAATNLRDHTLRTIFLGIYWTYSVILTLFAGFLFAVVLYYKDGVITHPVLAAGHFLIVCGAMLSTRKASLYTRRTM